ncbi:MAG: SAM-dependent methyltransferase [Actinobacteria bacterium HGW-Actinobacteria-1]|jgi:SAM-dependent methyltransferase|nr:MAG: SAM-dependent methyltransferase [Actinobacteria bacterium HGW-Actinobacteria-1]
MDRALLLQFDVLENTHWWFVVRRRLVMTLAAQWAPIETKRIIEIGCGTGGTLRSLQFAFPSASVGGIEPVEVAAELCRSRGSDVVVASMEDLPDPDESADLMLALDVIEHLENDVAGLAEVRRVLRPGGRVILTVPALPSLWGPHDVANAHFRRYTRRTLVRAVTDAGLSVERVSFFNAILLPAGWLERQVTRILRLRWSLGVGQPPRPMNAVMRGLFGLELPILKRLDLPVGMSLVLVASKPQREKG